MSERASTTLAVLVIFALFALVIWRGVMEQREEERQLRKLEDEVARREARRG